MGKLFNLLVIIISAITGIYLCIHAVELALAGHKDDGAWVGVAGFILTVYSVQQSLNLFRELFAKKVDPTKLDDSVQLETSEPSLVRKK
jgi:hypothetical protein